MYRIWHDDVRPAPEGWLRARTNAEALELLEKHDVACISMDHDLGSPEEGNVSARGTGEETGADLARAMVDRGLVPPVVRVHSWNPAGAQRIASIIAESGVIAEVAPYRV